MKARELLQLQAPDTIKKIAEFKEKIRRDELLRRFERCQHCGGRLRFSYSSEPTGSEVVEAASCHECGSKTASRLYRLN